MVNTLSRPHIYPTMKWLILANSYRYIDWLMGHMCNKYSDEILFAFRTSKRIYFDDGMDVNEFIFVSENDVAKVKGLHEDICICIDDFRQMWLLE